MISQSYPLYAVLHDDPSGQPDAVHLVAGWTVTEDEDRDVVPLLAAVGARTTMTFTAAPGSTWTLLPPGTALPEAVSYLEMVEAERLLNYALHLRQYGERAPGGDETWAEFDRRTEAFLRKLSGTDGPEYRR